MKRLFEVPGAADPIDRPPIHRLPDPPILDGDTQEMMLAHLLYWKRFGTACAHKLKSADFKPVPGTGEPDERTYSILVEQVLYYWHRYHKPPAKLIEKWCRQYATTIGMPLDWLKELPMYLSYLRTLVIKKPDPSETRSLITKAKEVADTRKKQSAENKRKHATNEKEANH